MMRTASGEIDLGILWGPMPDICQASEPPCGSSCSRKPRPALAFRIAMGVRARTDWKRQLNRLIAENRADINRLLLGFGVPLLDENDRPITDDTSAR